MGGVLRLRRAFCQRMDRPRRELQWPAAARIQFSVFLSAGSEERISTDCVLGPRNGMQPLLSILARDTRNSISCLANLFDINLDEVAELFSLSWLDAFPGFMA